MPQVDDQSYSKTASAAAGKSNTQCISFILPEPDYQEIVDREFRRTVDDQDASCQQIHKYIIYLLCGLEQFFFRSSTKPSLIIVLFAVNTKGNSLLNI